MQSCYTHWLCRQSLVFVPSGDVQMYHKCHKSTFLICQLEEKGRRTKHTKVCRSANRLNSRIQTLKEPHSEYQLRTQSSHIARLTMNVTRCLFLTGKRLSSRKSAIRFHSNIEALKRVTITYPKKNSNGSSVQKSRLGNSKTPHSNTEKLRTQKLNFSKNPESDLPA